VASTSFGDDCGESLVESPWERSRFAQNAYPLATYLGSQFVASLSNPASASTTPR
jgi:hypothetical protein